AEEEALAASGADEGGIVPFEGQAVHARDSARRELRPHRPVDLGELAGNPRGHAEFHAVLGEIAERRTDRLHLLLAELLGEDDGRALADLGGDGVVESEGATERLGRIGDSGRLDFDDDQIEFAGFGCHIARSYQTKRTACPSLRNEARVYQPIKFKSTPEENHESRKSRPRPTLPD